MVVGVVAAIMPLGGGGGGLPVFLCLQPVCRCRCVRSKQKLLRHMLAVVGKRVVAPELAAVAQPIAQPWSVQRRLVTGVAAAVLGGGETLPRNDDTKLSGTACL